MKYQYEDANLLWVRGQILKIMQFSKMVSEGAVPKFDLRGESKKWHLSHNSKKNNHFTYK